MVSLPLSSFAWLGDVYQDSPRLVVSAAISAGVALYYLIEVAKRPIFACRSRGVWWDFLDKHLSILQSRYWPTPWCFESRAQTILASVLRGTLPNISYTREVFKLEDGGEVCLDWLDPRDSQSKGASAPIVVLLPGLTGHSQSEYIKSFAMASNEVGARCVVFNNRGRGGIRLKTARTYCAANSDDFAVVVDHIKSKYPDAKLVAAGISLGGMILGNYLCTQGQRAAERIEAAMVLSIPWNVFIGTESLEKPLWNLMLNRHLAGCLCDSVRDMRDMLEGNHPWDLESVMKSRTIREFDSRFTAKQFGFRDVNEYYQTACLHDKLDNIKVPLICLSAADDPFQPIEGIPIESAKNSSHVAIVITARGGHIGFMEGLLPTNSYYSDRLFKQLLSGVFTDPDFMSKVKAEAMDYASKSS